MNPIVSLIFAIVAFAVFVFSLRSLLRSRQEKKKQQEEQRVRDNDGDKREMMWKSINNTTAITTITMYAVADE